MGRWLSRDPLGEAVGLNLYADVGNNPVNWVDPWGLDFETPACYEVIQPILVYPCMAVLGTTVNFTSMNKPPHNYLNGTSAFRSDFRHCYTTCLSSQLCGRATFVETGADIFEIVQTFLRSGNDRSQTVEYRRDMKANRYGLMCASHNRECSICCDTLPSFNSMKDFGQLFWLYLIMDTLHMAE